jgi:curved DNA-binding protein CbpA
MSAYGIFGAETKEPPQLTNARAVMGLGRDANADDIKKRHRQLSMLWHPDRHVGKSSAQEASTRFQLYAAAYGLLSKEKKQIQANIDFQKALEEPFIVGDRLFCLGSLYGTRIFIPKESKGPRITDSSKLLGGAGLPSEASYSTLQKKQYFGIRSSIMESSFADTLEMFYGGQPVGQENAELFAQAFVNKHLGGLDDLVWIRNNELGMHDFMNRDFRKAVDKFTEINKRIQGNIVFMFRQGVCLEAMVAESGFKQNHEEAWSKNMHKALGLYEACMQKLQARNYSYPEDSEAANPWYDPTSMLTVMMQAGDAYDRVGERDKAKKLWSQVKRIDPDCYEAQVKSSSLATKISSGKILLMLNHWKKSKEASQ